MSQKENFSIGVLQLDVAMTVAKLPSAVGRKGSLVYVVNGAAGSPCLAVSDGTNWKVVTISGTTVSAT